MFLGAPITFSSLDETVSKKGDKARAEVGNINILQTNKYDLFWSGEVNPMLVSFPRAFYN